METRHCKKTQFPRTAVLGSPGIARAEPRLGSASFHPLLVTHIFEMNAFGSPEILQKPEPDPALWVNYPSRVIFPGGTHPEESTLENHTVASELASTVSRPHILQKCTQYIGLWFSTFFVSRNPCLTPSVRGTPPRNLFGSRGTPIKENAFYPKNPCRTVQSFGSPILAGTQDTLPWQLNCFNWES